MPWTTGLTANVSGFVAHAGIVMAGLAVIVDETEMPHCASPSVTDRAG